VGDDPLCHLCILGIGGDTFYRANCLFLWFWALLLTVYKSFTPFGNFFTDKKDSSMHPSILANVCNCKTAWWTAAASLAFGFRHRHCSLIGKLSTYDYTIMSVPYHGGGRMK
jgi:hypothetical protein